MADWQQRMKILTGLCILTLEKKGSISLWLVFLTSSFRFFLFFLIPFFLPLAFFLFLSFFCLFFSFFFCPSVSLFSSFFFLRLFCSVCCSAPLVIGPCDWSVLVLGLSMFGLRL